MQKNRTIKLGTLASAIIIALSGCGNDNSSTTNPHPDRHVASPDWRDQIIYFLMIDRFNDGDSSNNDQGTGEYDPSSDKKFSGGDLLGVQQKLDYIAGLGATTV